VNTRRGSIRTTVLFFAACALGIPGGVAASPPQNVLFGRVEVQDVPQAWLGVKFQHVVTHDSVRVLLTSVFPRSPAARAGLRSGDRLLRVNGSPATTKLITSLAPRIEAGDPFTFEVLRGDTVIEARLVAESRPESGDIIVTRMQTQLDTLRKLIGITLDSLERAGAGNLPALEVRRVDGTDGSVTLVVSDGRGVVTGSAVTLSRLTDPVLPSETWAPRTDLRVGIRTDREAARAAADVEAWAISSSLLPYAEGARRVAGAGLHPVGDDLGRYLGIDRGLMVSEVTPGTPAAKAGMRPGDVLVSVDNVEIETVSDFRALVSVPASVRTLRVVRHGATVELALRR